MRDLETAPGSSRFRRSHLGLLVLAGLALAAPAAAQDVVSPAEVEGLELAPDGVNTVLSWLPVTQDVTGQPEVVDHYKVYRSASPQFPQSYRLAGTTPSTTLVDFAAKDDSASYFYLVVAVDAEGNEGHVRSSTIQTPPVLSGTFTSSAVDLDWTDAQPDPNVAGYLVYYGASSRSLDTVVDVGLVTSHTLIDLLPDTAYFIRVAALDANGDVSPLSNEVNGGLDGTVEIRAQDEARLCPFNACPTKDGEVPRDGGREILIPVDFPDGDWVNAQLTFTVDSRLCSNVPDKCGDQNPGWNPCGDPWDRTTSVTLVLNECMEQGSRCYGNSGNIELLHAVTPFGTDAPPPDGSGVVPPRVWTFDITPYAPLLKGRKYVSAWIGTWVVPGWFTTVDFHLSEDPGQASAEPPADGIVPVSFRDGGNVATATPVSIPASATQVFMRLFTTGHGGVWNTNCDCYPGGPGPCDEFCSKTLLLKVNNNPRWGVVPSSICSNQCGQWNACGFPSCTYDRAGWCPGEISCHQTGACDQDIDMTSILAPGGTYDVLLEVRGMTPGASWANSLAVYWYEGP